MTPPSREWSLFAENRANFELRLDRRVNISSRERRDGGVASWERQGLNARQDARDDRPIDLAEEFGTEGAKAVAATLEDPPRLVSQADALAVAQALRHRAASSGVDWLEVLVSHNWQRVVVLTDEAVRSGLRESVVIEMRATLPNIPGSLWRCCAYSNPGELNDLSRAMGRLDELVAALQSGPAVPCPRGKTPVVLAAGSAAGSFFHEICGHPLEGDVVARLGSFLSSRLNQRVAGAHVSIWDDPSGEPEALQYEFDDEGTQATPVVLIEQGKVREPLLDKLSAARLGRVSNGHGRRVTFRHAPMPRMAHTRVKDDRGSMPELLRGVPSGILIQHLVPRHVNLLSGDFSFFLLEGRLIEGGKPGPLISPGILRGNALDALDRIAAIGHDGRALLSTRGCRKGDHGPLAVSFGQPTVLISELETEPPQS